MLASRLAAALAVTAALLGAGCGGGDDSVEDCDGYYGFPELTGTADYLEPNGTAQSLTWFADGQVYYHNSGIPYLGWDASAIDVSFGEVTLWLDRAAAPPADYDTDEIPLQACQCDLPTMRDVCEPGAATSTCFALTGTITVRELWRRCPDGGEHPIPDYYDDSVHDDCEQLIDIDVEATAADAEIEFALSVTATSNPMYIATDCDG